MSAADWREFWQARGMSELQLVLWTSWDPIGGTPPDEYEPYALRIASLLGSRASRDALVEELGRIRHDQLRLEDDRERDEAAAEKVADWFEHATRVW